MESTKMDVCAQTDIGLKRKRNEDSLLVVDDLATDPRLGSLFVVADGMGGHPAGDLASRLACDALKDAYFRSISLKERFALFLRPGQTLLARLEFAVRTAQKRLCRYEITHRKCKGFGTTLSALVIAHKWAIICHVGDSRIYRLRDGELVQLTVDDTLVQEMVREGDMELEEAKTSPYRHVLTQALGGGFDLVHTRIEPVRHGDTYLLSTDGLHDLVSHERIKELLGSSKVASICPMLIEAALARGGKDNVTVIVVRIR